MPEVGKRQFTVKKMISPFGEVKGGKVPAWVEAIPGALKDFAPIMINRKIELDPRKWKQKDLEDGIYAVAKYELATMATKTTQAEKKLTSALPKEALKKKPLEKFLKESYKEHKNDIDKATAEMAKTWKKLAKDIEDKISLALDEAEADKGDNKQAIKSGKEALKKFNGLPNKSQMFSKPVGMLVDAMKKLSTDLSGSNPDTDRALKEAEKKVSAAEAEVNKTAKAVQQVVKYFLDSGKKMSRDKEAHAKLVEVGKYIVSKSSGLEKLEETFDLLDSDLKDAYALARDNEVKYMAPRRLANELEKGKGAYEKTNKEAMALVNEIAKKFADAEKEAR